MMEIRKLLLFSVLILIPFQSVFAQTEGELELCRQFAFRYANKILKLPKQEQALRINSDNVQIKKGSLEEIRKFSLSQDTTLTWNMFYDGKKYQLQAEKNASTILDMIFPADTQLLLGKSLLILEDEWCTRAKQFKAEPNDSSLLHSGDSVVFSGNYMIEDIKKALYYKNGNLILCDSMAIESTMNLLQVAALGKNITIDMSVRRFGFKKDDIIIDLSSFIEMLHRDNFDLYVGIEKITEQQVKASLFAVGKLLRINHLIVFSIPKTVLASKEGQVTADATLYIPTHNIKSLFGELEE